MYEHTLQRRHEQRSRIKCVQLGRLPTVNLFLCEKNRETSVRSFDGVRRGNVANTIAIRSYTFFKCTREIYLSHQNANRTDRQFTIYKAYEKTKQNNYFLYSTPRVIDLSGYDSYLHVLKNEKMKLYNKKLLYM